MAVAARRRRRRIPCGVGQRLAAPRPRPLQGLCPLKCARGRHGLWPTRGVLLRGHVGARDCLGAATPEGRQACGAQALGGPRVGLSEGRGAGGDAGRGATAGPHREHRGPRGIVRFQARRRHSRLVRPIRRVGRGLRGKAFAAVRREPLDAPGARKQVGAALQADLWRLVQHHALGLRRLRARAGLGPQRGRSGDTHRACRGHRGISDLAVVDRTSGRECHERVTTDAGGLCGHRLPHEERRVRRGPGPCGAARARRRRAARCRPARARGRADPGLFRRRPR
mmetsp:Transcript_88444/g.255096  ORF Transcript_88444/g.255096 Transcript_88444/m.255096 type:complete len:282 (+) Transcript_88444:358-1203(+)